MLQRTSGYGMAARMHTTAQNWLARLCLPMLLLSCAPEERGEDVWNTYDVRHPVSANVPQQYAYPVDNDAYYAPPDCTIMDSPACGE